MSLYNIRECSSTTMPMEDLDIASHEWNSRYNLQQGYNQHYQNQHYQNQHNPSVPHHQLISQTPVVPSNTCNIHHNLSEVLKKIYDTQQGIFHTVNFLLCDREHRIIQKDKQIEMLCQELLNLQSKYHQAFENLKPNNRRIRVAKPTTNSYKPVIGSENEYVSNKTPPI